MKFAKYQGTGNDFVMVSDLRDTLELTPLRVRSLCDRRFGIGADGVIRVAPSENAHFFMDYVNADGSLSEMCGNGIRCLAVFARAEGLTDERVIEVDTRAGIKTVSVEGSGVRVDMGAPLLEADALHSKLELDDQTVEAAVLSMGNPHAVLFVDDARVAPVTTLGPRLEQHPIFPNRANIEFVTVEAPDRITMRVWERGSRETLACGTGAGAAAAAARLLHGTDPRVTVTLPGGDLEIEWNGSLTDQEPLFMTGPAEEVYTGEVKVP